MWLQKGKTSFSDHLDALKLSEPLFSLSGMQKLWQISKSKVSSEVKNTQIKWQKLR